MSHTSYYKYNMASNRQSDVKMLLKNVLMKITTHVKITLKININK
jgi:hypothetical protein